MVGGSFGRGGNKIMKKPMTRYECSECGSISLTMMGRCPACAAWGSMVEEKITVSSPSSAVRAVPISVVDIPSQKRIPSGIQELDRVLGGGWVPGGVVLLGGEPGVGKSTLLLQVCCAMAQEGHRVLYISGEESSGQLALRAHRIGAVREGIDFICQQDFLSILEDAKEYAFIVLDSVQAFRLPDESGWMGSPNQVRNVASRAAEVSKKFQIPLVLVGHITKQGQIAGPKLLEHMVDVVLLFSGDRNSLNRLLRAEKNRYGSTEELGIFEMSAEGLTPVADPSRLYWNGHVSAVPGMALTVTLEGSRPLIAEIQALTCATPFPYPKRTSRGIEVNRLQLLLAVLERRCGLSSRNQDVYVNVAAGLSIDDPAADLAVCAALASSLKDHALAEDCCFIGEVGLGGEIRPTPRTGLRLREAARLGFKCAIVSKREKESDDSIRIIGVESIREVFERIFK